MRYCEVWMMEELVVTMNLEEEIPVKIHTDCLNHLPSEVRGVLRRKTKEGKPNQYALVQACTMFVLDRTFPKTRQNCREVVKTLGLDNFNKLEIVEKTYGLLYHDLFWVKLDPEDKTEYKDIKIRK